jgi:Fe-S cluster assembly scaffold protein SufB
VRTWRRRASSSSTPTTALREHPDLFQEYFATVIPVGDNKFAALNTAVWSGGSFIYVPKNVHVRSRCRPTSGSTPRTWASSSGR